MLAGHAGQLLSVQHILAAHLDGLQTGQHIQLGQADAVEVVDQVSVAHLGQVQPAAATRTASSRTEFMTDLLQALTHLVLCITRGNQSYDLFSRERTLAHTCGVGLHNAVHGTDLVGTDAQTCADTTNRGRGGSDVRVGAEVDIQHRSVGTFDEDLLTCLESGVDFIDRVADHGEQLGQHGLDLGELTFEIIVGEVVADAVLCVRKWREKYDFENTHVLLLEAVPVLQRTHTDTITLHLGSVGWTNTTLGGTDLEITTVQFVNAIANLMEIEHNVSTIGYVQSSCV